MKCRHESEVFTVRSRSADSVLLDVTSTGG